MKKDKKNNFILISCLDMVVFLAKNRKRIYPSEFDDYNNADIYFCSVKKGGDEFNLYCINEFQEDK